MSFQKKVSTPFIQLAQVGGDVEGDVRVFGKPGIASLVDAAVVQYDPHLNAAVRVICAWDFFNKIDP
ncbi:MAG: hypothetical protein LBQ79_07650 [Deltaproteobacteria bacterium]|nr:hypothetical protein [Deltaproteobacteria bacterium]